MLLGVVRVVHRLLSLFHRSLIKSVARLGFGDVVDIKLLIAVFVAVFLLDFGADGLEIDILTCFIVLRKLEADHLSEARENDKENHKCDNGRQTHTHHRVLFFFIKSHLLLLHTLLIVAVLGLQSLELRLHTLHRLAVFAADNLLPHVKRRENQTQNHGKDHDNPAEADRRAAHTVADDKHKLSHKVSGRADGVACDAVGIVVVTRNKHNAAEDNQCGEQINLQFAFAFVA